MTEGGKKGRGGGNNSNKQRKEEDILKSISSKCGVLLHPQVTLTCYIPTHCVGAVIGKRGSTILQIQREAAKAGTGPVRVSIVSPEEEVPYTYSELDLSSKHWTPVVIRADPCAALAAGQKLLDLVDGDMDEVVMDIGLARSKHAALIGKRGLVLANLSADTQVRIMVPRKEVRHDVIQLEGDLDKVRLCFEKVLVLVDKRNGIVTVSHQPSQTKLRNIGRKTETVIKKKKLDDDAWQLIVSGNTQDQIQQAVSILERWRDEQTNNEKGDNNAQQQGGGGGGAEVGGEEKQQSLQRRGGRGGRAGGGRKNAKGKGKKAASAQVAPAESNDT